MQYMAHIFLLFDFGGNEEVAQTARHKVDGWKQGFRLGKKLELKFERTGQEPASDTEAPAAKAKGDSKAKAASKAKSKTAEKAGKSADSEAEAAQIRLLVRLDFSDHEKLSSQRWLERIPTEEPFKTVKAKVIRSGDAEFQSTEDLFDTLD